MPGQGSIERQVSKKTISKEKAREISQLLNPSSDDGLMHITSILLDGDSLTDRGKMASRKLLGFIPMDLLTGLRKESPKGRFTNGLGWGDILAQILIDTHELDVIEDRAKRSYAISHESDPHVLAQQLNLKSSKLKKEIVESKIKGKRSFDDSDLETLKRKHGQFARLYYEGGSEACSRAEISDGILTEEKSLNRYLSDQVEFDDEDHILYRDKKLVRSYAEGGLTARNFREAWRSLLSWSPKLFFSRLILKSLRNMRELIDKDDQDDKRTQEQKGKTLFIELSGANDLVTVNKVPTEKIAQKAVDARIDNVKRMIDKGYKHFVLFNLPDLSLTPLYRNEKKKDANYAYLASKYFNEQLAKQVRELQASHKDCTIEIFDMASTFEKVFDTPEEYGFDRDKLSEPFLNHIDDPIDEYGKSPSKGYAFWDDLHPTADMLAFMAVELVKFLEPRYHVNPTGASKYHLHDKDDKMTSVSLSGPTESESIYRQRFEKAYASQLFKDYSKLGGSWRKSGVKLREDDVSAHKTSMNAILSHGLLHAKSRTHKVMEQLEFLDEKGELKETVKSACGMCN